MATEPYRSASESPAGGEPKDDAALLGPRRTFVPPPLGRALLPALLSSTTALTFAVTFGLAYGAYVTAVTLPGILVLFVVLAWSPLRCRSLRIDLHASGLTVSRAGRREVVAFEDVDEVWFVVEAGSHAAVVRALRFVLRDRSQKLVPLAVQGANDLLREVHNRCTRPLQVEALRALDAGETLTFGAVRLERDGIGTPAWQARWKELSLVRYVPGRLCFFRGQRVFPWKSIRLDEVPHPLLFAALVRRCAGSIESDTFVAWLTS
jgi:hypothetical protein